MASEHKENIDNIITYIFIKKLVTPITKSAAYRMGLVNNAGRMVKKAETPEEKNAFTLLDKLIFKLKRLLGSKLINLNSFLYLTTLSNDFYNKLISRGSVNQRAEIIRIKRDMEKLSEKYDTDIDGLIETLMVENIHNK
jgi:hypothetical protein